MTCRVHILFENHREFSALHDVVALFAEQYEETERGFELTLFGKLREADQPIILISRTAREVSKEEMRGQRPGAPVLITTLLDPEGRREGVSEELWHPLELVVEARELRRELKRQVYMFLSALSGIRWPWGSLTGIRPTQIALEALENSGRDEGRALDILVNRWRLQREKAVKALKTAKKEDEILTGLQQDDIMVYAGIPFCPGRCSYCSFISRDAFRQSEWLGRYAEAMVHEIRHVFRGSSFSVSALYLGGGTPTSLCEQDFAKVLETLVREIPLKEGAEITVEAGRPDTINKEKLAIMKDCGADRICINPQTMNDATLARIGRFHNAQDVRECFSLARSMGFKHINMDLIIGLPGENGEDFKRSLNELLLLGPESITVHTLALKRSSGLQSEKSELYLPLRFPDEVLQKVLSEGERRLQEQGYEPYYLYRQKNVRGGLENTGFAKNNAYCIYNVGMMSDLVSVIGLGSGASSKRVKGRLVERLHNSKDIRDYTERAEELAEKKRQFFAEL